MASFLTDVNLDLLVSGYIRKKEDDLKLYMNIPREIARIIHELYPLLLFKFGDCRKEAFTISNEGTMLKGNSPDSFCCSGHAIYADLDRYSDIGFAEGIHRWSIRFSGRPGFKHYKTPHCYASIGVTTERNEKLINEPNKGFGHWITRKGSNSWYEGCGTWKRNDIITIELDCNSWEASYRRNDEEQCIKKDKLEPNKSYFLALFCCADKRYTNMEVVDTPYN